MKHLLPPLPYPKNALEPILSQETLEFHYGKHHKGYVDKLNKLVEGTNFDDLTLEQLIKVSNGAIFNNASQAWNHTFFWKCMSPDRQSLPDQVLTCIRRDFNTLDTFEEEFLKKGTELFGSGYLWLVEDSGKLKLEAKSNAQNPLTEDKKILMNCDLWEHAYYIDYRNERPKYLQEFYKLINWDFVQRNLNASAQVAA